MRSHACPVCACAQALASAVEAGNAARDVLMRERNELRARVMEQEQVRAEDAVYDLIRSIVPLTSTAVLLMYSCTACIARPCSARDRVDALRQRSSLLRVTPVTSVISGSACSSL
jgi:hypothetical protein